MSSEWKQDTVNRRNFRQGEIAIDETDKLGKKKGGKRKPFSVQHYRLAFDSARDPIMGNPKSWQYHWQPIWGSKKFADKRSAIQSMRSIGRTGSHIPRGHSESMYLRVIDSDTQEIVAESTWITDGITKTTKESNGRIR